MTAIAAALDVLFADPNLARDAVYRAGDAEPGLPVRVVLRQPDRIAEFGATRIASETALLEVRIGEVATPAAGDSFELDGQRLLVQGEPLADAELLLWTIEARPA